MSKHTIRRTARAPEMRFCRADDPNRPSPPAGFVAVKTADGTLAFIPQWKLAEMRREGDTSVVEIEGAGR